MDEQSTQCARRVKPHTVLTMHVLNPLGYLTFCLFAHLLNPSFFLFRGRKSVARGMSLLNVGLFNVLGFVLVVFCRFLTLCCPTGL